MIPSSVFTEQKQTAFSSRSKTPKKERKNFSKWEFQSAAKTDISAFLPAKKTKTKHNDFAAPCKKSEKTVHIPKIRREFFTIRWKKSNMKTRKITASIMAAAMTLTFVSCEKSEEKTENNCGRNQCRILKGAYYESAKRIASKIKHYYLYNGRYFWIF